LICNLNEDCLPSQPAAELMRKHALIIANGEPPQKKRLALLIQQAGKVICADGGANTALKMGITPDAIVGDLDSVHAEALVKFRRVAIHEDRNDETTDLEKAIAWAIQLKYDHITVVGASGRRLDHTVGNLGVLPKFFPDAIVTLVDDHGELCYVGREYTFEAGKGDVVSLLPLNRCEGVSTTGLRYPLEGEILELGVREGTSNIVVSSPVSIKVKKGHLLLFKLFGRT
jgi:thiamine pyrophosphokinase